MNHSTHRLNPPQAIASSRGVAITALLKPIKKALDSILDRRLLPIRSIAAQVCSSTVFGACGCWRCAAARACHQDNNVPRLQANHAHSVAFILRTCSDELSLRHEPVVYIADACAAMEMSDAAISASASFRGAPVRTEAIVRLRTACLQVLSAAIDWRAFRQAH